MGIPMPRSVSKRTVSRAILEGGVAAKLQLGHEVKQAKSFTISADSTTHCRINYESKHIAVAAPNYSEGPDAEAAPKVRLFGVDHLPSHSSETSQASWQDKLAEISTLYSASPLAKRQGLTIDLTEFASKLMGMNGDHASAEKCTAKMMGDWKKEKAIEALGDRELEDMAPAELVALILDWTQKKIREAGGIDAWDALTDAEQAEKDIGTAKALVVEVGKAAFENLSSAQQREITLFLWSGCCMHKEQNSFKGGNTAMMAGWKDLDTEPPIVLANKHNAAILQRLSNPASPPSTNISEIELEALEKSTRGGAKAASIAGAIFNNKDDKKGQGDTYRSYFEMKYGKSSPFPGTNNTRFGSHGEAAIELIKNLDGYLAFMNDVKYRKKRPALTNLEENLVRALQDPPTLTELCILGLYMLAVTFPYMRAVRGPGNEHLNGLDLGPLHVKVRAHVQKIIDSPLLLLGTSISYIDATLDGNEWEDEEGLRAIQKQIVNLPFVKPLLIKFFQGALATWIRFSSEYAPGGLIDGTSQDERTIAWMPATNDANEGALGALRRHLREKPLVSIHQYNAIAMFRSNNTAEWMEEHLTDEDHTFLMKQARLIDQSKLEVSRKRKQVYHDDTTARAGEEKERAKRQRVQDESDRIAKIVLIDVAQVNDKLKVPAINEQLDLLRTLLPKGSLPAKSKSGKKANKLELLRGALASHNSRNQVVDDEDGDDTMIDDEDGDSEDEDGE
ncbi:hypothetical protein ONZ45_g19419 [Pleurotus djamor]|nr:hypothetical protein ONZ45_g19419 [Pleurotus djamor]